MPDPLTRSASCAAGVTAGMRDLRVFTLWRVPCTPPSAWDDAFGGERWVTSSRRGLSLQANVHRRDAQTRAGQVMKTRLAIAVLITLATIVVTLTAASAANGPYFPTPSWDQQLACASSTNCPRFIVLSNWIDATYPSGGAAVLDLETGLVWQRNPGAAPLTWPVALHDPTYGCMGATTGGRTGWRAPRVEELLSLIGTIRQNGSTVLPAGHPFGPNAVGVFWSSTTSAFGSDMAEIWTIGDVSGSNGFEFKTQAHRVWCVRSSGPAF